MLINANAIHQCFKNVQKFIFFSFIDISLDSTFYGKHENTIKSVKPKNIEVKKKGVENPPKLNRKEPIDGPSITPKQATPSRYPDTLAI